MLFKIAARADGPDAARACRETWKRYLIAVAIIVAIAAATRATELAGWHLASRQSAWLAGAAALVVLVVLVVLAWTWWSTVRLTGRLRAAVAPAA